MQHVVNLLKIAEGIIFSLEKDANMELKYPVSIDYVKTFMDTARMYVCGMIDEFEFMIGEIDEDAEKIRKKNENNEEKTPVDNGQA